jgi:tetratricopeptide (TPR) repeat protein
VFALLFALSATGAWADMYDDCTQGKDLDLSISACTQIIQGGKQESLENRARAYNKRGIAYYMKGEFDRAIADYTKAIALDAKNAKAYYNRGLAYHEKGEVDRAIANYTKAIALDPNFALAYNNRGVAYAMKGDKEQAIADFRKALEIDPLDQYAKESLAELGVTP